MLAAPFRDHLTVPPWVHCGRATGLSKFPSVSGESSIAG